MAVVTGAVAAAVGAGSSLINGSKANKIAQQSAAQQGEIAGRQLAIAEEQHEWAIEDRKRYKDRFQPLEDQLIEESRGLGSIANQNRGAQQAAADVAGSFGMAREKLNKTAQGSQAAAQDANRLNLAEAAASAAGQTAARQAARDRGTQALVTAANIGRGLPGQATSGMSGASGIMTAASGGLGRAGEFASGQARAYAQDFGAGMRAIGGLAANSAFRNWVSGYTPGGSAASNMPDNIDVGGGWSPAAAPVMVEPTFAPTWT